MENNNGPIYIGDHDVILTSSAYGYKAYYGKQTNDNEIATRGYVDSAVSASNSGMSASVSGTTLILSGGSSGSTPGGGGESSPTTASTLTGDANIY